MPVLDSFRDPLNSRRLESCCREYFESASGTYRVYKPTTLNNSRYLIQFAFTLLLPLVMRAALHGVRVSPFFTTNENGFFDNT
jgi:hypothetical protein